MSELKLYELSGDYREALEVLTDLDDDAVQDTLEGLKGALEKKSINIGYYIGNLEATATAIDNAIEQMEIRKKAFQKKADSIRNWLKLNMESCGISEIIAPEFTLKIVKNPPKLIIGDEDLIPKRFKEEIITTKINKSWIKSDIKNGEEVQGCNLEFSTRLRIK